MADGAALDRGIRIIEAIEITAVALEKLHRRAIL